MPKKNGFSLIELMLSIAILAMIASIGLLVLRHKIETNRIEKSSLEIQSVLESAVNYYNQTQAWPETDFQNTTQTCQPNDPDNNPFIKNYLANENYHDTFGGNYCWGNQTDSPTLFWVAVKIPSNNINFAKRIAAELPNGAVTSDPSIDKPDECDKTTSCYVRAEVNASNNSSSKSSGIVGVGVCHSNSKIQGSTSNLFCSCKTPIGNRPTICHVTFHCPKNTLANVYATPNDVYLPHVSRDYSQYSLGELNTIIKNCQVDDSGHASCELDPVGKTITGNYFGVYFLHPGHIGANYIATCHAEQKQTHWL